MGTDLYSLRCNDPAEKKKWRSSGLVAIETLRKGDVFESISGSICRYVRRDEKTRGLHHVFAESSGLPDIYLGIAMVRPIEVKNDRQRI